MKKILLIVLAVATYSMALNPFSYFWTIKLTGDTATVTKWKKNNDSVLAWSGKVADTLNKGIPRWLAFANHDSTFKWMNIDTIPSADTIQSTAIGGTRGTFTGVLKADSLASTKGISAVKGNFSGTVTVDSLKSTKGISATTFTGNVTGNITGNQSGGSVTATTGTFSGTLGVDSLASTKGISAVKGNFSGTVLVDTLKSTKGINATKGVFSGTVTVDTLKSTKGVNATTFTGNLTGNVTGNTSGSSGSCTGNSLTASDISSTYTSFVCSLFVNSGASDTFKVANTCYYQKIGKNSTIHFTGDFNFTCAALSVVYLRNIPAVVQPIAASTNWVCYARQNGTNIAAVLNWSSGNWILSGQSPTQFGGDCRFYGTSISTLSN